MLEQISQLVKQYGQEAVINNPDVPNENNNAVLAEATRTITGGMQNMLAGGGLQDIISMFTGGRSPSGNQAQSGGIGGLLKNPMVTMMIGHFISKLVGKYNMNHNQASRVANQLIPNVLNDVVTKTNSTAPEDDVFDLNDLVGSLTGGSTASAGLDLQGLLRQFTDAGDGNRSGFDLQDVINRVTDGAQQGQEQQAKSGGGVAEMIRGFFN